MRFGEIMWWLVTLGLVGFLIWFFLPSMQAQTCEEKCESLGYNISFCRTGAVVPNITQCEADEINVGETIDCTTSEKIGRTAIKVTVGAWKACCCK